MLVPKLKLEILLAQEMTNVVVHECVAVWEQHSHGWVWGSAMGAVTVGAFMCDMWLGVGGSVCVCVCVCDLHLTGVLASPT